MRLAIFGSTGRIGHIVVEQALEAGHDVQAFVRDRYRLTHSHPHLTVFEGTLDDGETVIATLRGADAVISALSAGRETLTRFGAAALPVMQMDGPRRIVTLVGASLRMPDDPEALSLKLMTLAMRLIPGRMIEDAEAHARQLARSGLDWTLVRSANFTNAPGTGKIFSSPGHAMAANASIPRADVGQFLLETAVADRFVHSAPMIQSA